MSLVKNISVVLGDGIGPEITSQAIRVLDVIANKYGHNFNYSYLKHDAKTSKSNMAALEKEMFDISSSSDAILFGPINDTNNWPNEFKKALGLYATIRPVASFPSLYHLSPLKSSALTDANLVVYREIEGGKVSTTGEDKNENESKDLLKYNPEDIQRIAELAYNHAQKRRKKVTLFHKSNELETSRCWEATIKKIASKYPDIETQYLQMDKGVFELIDHPMQFDVILADHTFGDIISSISTAIAGSRGMLPSASIGENIALFETVLGTYPEAAGKDIANPIGSILSAAMMLRHFGLKEEVEKIIHAVEWTVEHGFVTKDIDPVNFYFTTTIGEMICDHIQNNSLESVHIENIQLRKSTII
jgi:3-isopropylmalate dehydrogenase